MRFIDSAVICRQLVGGTANAKNVGRPPLLPDYICLFAPLMAFCEASVLV